MTVDAEQFEILVQKAFAGLPETFREVCRDVVVRSVDFASREVLDSFGMDDPYELLGLYHGTPLVTKDSLEVPASPDMVDIYRVPILEYAAASGHPVETVVNHVLVHEIGHHFGFSDDDMEAIEASA